MNEGNFLLRFLSLGSGQQDENPTSSATAEATVETTKDLQRSTDKPSVTCCVVPLSFDGFFDRQQHPTSEDSSKEERDTDSESPDRNPKSTTSMRVFSITKSRSLASQDDMTFDTLDKQTLTAPSDEDEDSAAASKTRNVELVMSSSVEDDLQAGAKYKRENGGERRSYDLENGADAESKKREIQEHMEEQQGNLSRRYKRLLLSSNLFFVMGAVLYMVMSVDELKWAKEAQTIPLHVLLSNDATVWMEYRSTGSTSPTDAPVAIMPTMDESTTLILEDSNATNGDARRRNTIRRRRERQLSTYEDYSWSELPPNVQAAAEVLGYDENHWDNSIAVYTEELAWDELSPEQQNAAEVLGYSQEAWDATLEETTIDETTAAPTNNKDKDTTTTDNAAVSSVNATAANNAVTTTGAPVPTLTYDDVLWEDLPETALVAAVLLGYTENRWNKDLPPTLVENENPDWDELTPQQQEAAKTLGYSAESWWYIRRDINGGSNNGGTQSNGDTATVTGAPSSNSTAVVEWEQYSWDELPEDAQAAFSVLGWDRSLWDNGGTVATESTLWQELTPKQREAALFLGYNQAQWDGLEKASSTVSPTGGTVPKETGTEVPSTATEDDGEDSQGEAEPVAQDAPDKEWYDYWWSELPPEVQAAYAALGYSQDSWDNNKPVATTDMRWSELTPEQQQAAASLGYYQAIWEDVANHVILDGYISADDDFVFFVPSRQVWVSRYMILYFAAALCFVFTGVLDYVRERKRFHLFMILGGLFGLASAMLIEKDRIASTVLSLISVHLFLLEGINVVRYRIISRKQALAGRVNGHNIGVPDTTLLSGLWWIPTLHITADLFFVLGALLDAILSYFYFDISSDWNLAIARVSGFASFLWLACSVLYLHITLVLCYGLFPCCLGQDKHPEAVTARERETPKMAYVGPSPETTERESVSQ